MFRSKRYYRKIDGTTSMVSSSCQPRNVACTCQQRSDAERSRRDDPHNWSNSLSELVTLDLAGMPQTDSIIAFAAVFSTIGLYSADILNGGKALVFSDPVTTSQKPMTRRDFWPKSATSTEPSMRGLTSLAFFYLAYRDYERTTCHETTSANEFGLTSCRWKAWALCGTIGLAVGPFSPYRVILMRPLEQRLQDQALLSDEKARELVARWGRLALGRGIIIFASFPICLKAFRLRKRGEAWLERD